MGSSMNDSERVQSSVTGSKAVTEIVEKRGYLIANYTVHDQKTYEKYLQAAGMLNSKYNLKANIYDENTKAVEGEPKLVIAIAEFPSLQQAEQFYNSAEYRTAMKLRLASTNGSVMLAESLSL